jgi:AraC-like DNA-binding protein
MPPQPPSFYRDRRKIAKLKVHMLLGYAGFAGLCRARDLLLEVRDRQLSIKDVAREARISPFHFIRQFDALFGLTPHQFRIRSRLDRAKLLLAMGQLSVTEVCMEVGFSSLGSFSDLFARRVGTAPSIYQRRARVMVQVPGALPKELFPGCLSLMSCLPPSAFRNFREAFGPPAPLDCGVSLREGVHANQAHKHHGR